ncbi:hypothetical protein [Herbidospora mongoliensis]|uniref:hypothetical protein n=1 Tax=Herbidospora mongoliensis TaxID=688067 RepID=UPI00082A9949|nr:hypothetical protein [Herbidospora mongoliensis]
MTVMRIVSVATGAETSRATINPDDTVTYTGGDSAASAVLRWRHHNRSASEADAVRALIRDGWSNGYQMVKLDDTTP